ncbi:hypothetical protein A6R68_04603 [Neotoma lepida]|uniref:Secretory carrier-associated membrane protein n=1 Tax=Neotoma lepida TaxID=56216 RepID=A0A1A6GMC0_NEOLE|nr:hypothetical protein A6R68_04603 [Neotoma lepida]
MTVDRMCDITVVEVRGQHLVWVLVSTYLETNSYMLFTVVHISVRMCDITVVEDPSVTQVTRNVPPGLDEYNPFSDSRTIWTFRKKNHEKEIASPSSLQGPCQAVISNHKRRSVKMPNVPNTQPAIMKPTEEHPAYTQITKEHALAQAELLKRQEELERKAAELDRREREMQSLSQHVHAVTLFLNIFGCLAWFCVDSSRAVDFGLSILWFLLFTPCSFVCWYRPLYGAFRSDSSFRFFVFFFVYICQFAVHVLQAAGFHNWGNCGWISSLTGLNKNIPVGIMMIIIAALFTASAVISLVMFKKVSGNWSLDMLQSFELSSPSLGASEARLCEVLTPPAFFMSILHCCGLSPKRVSSGLCEQVLPRLCPPVSLSCQETEQKEKTVCAPDPPLPFSSSLCSPSFLAFSPSLDYNKPFPFGCSVWVVNDCPPPPLLHAHMVKPHFFGPLKTTLVQNAIKQAFMEKPGTNAGKWCLVGFVSMLRQLC